MFKTSQFATQAEVDRKTMETVIYVPVKRMNISYLLQKKLTLINIYIKKALKKL